MNQQQKQDLQARIDEMRESLKDETPPSSVVAEATGALNRLRILKRRLVRQLRCQPPPADSTKPFR